MIKKSGLSVETVQFELLCTLSLYELFSIIGNLSSDSNFPRRNASLELLLVICEIIPRHEWIKYWTAEDVKNSHNILFDTYECNKKMIVTLFKTLPPEYLGFMVSIFVRKFNLIEMQIRTTCIF